MEYRRHQPPPSANKTGTIRTHTCAEEILQALRMRTLLPYFPHAINAKQVRWCVGDVACMMRGGINFAHAHF
ncbi:hypothetical protein XELAEV_18041614mg [Xenopus laevis]|uniref:Uncharacterized protein n=1 Tax=Xenopus laevis TaxID=8355 RepID=A0A974H592_XENLA|nr:hypothetical protein XELAEV_18041614mg [Xenopus laevis]